jgi:hypothetical protein
MDVDNVEEFESYVLTATFGCCHSGVKVFSTTSSGMSLGSFVRWQNLQHRLLTRPFDRRFASVLAIRPGRLIQDLAKFRN